MRKCLVILMTMMLLLGCAAADTLTHGQFSYTLAEDGVVITGYTLPENPTAIQIPDAIEGKPVVEIAAGAFEDKQIKTISIPASVKRIAGNAFYGCSKDLNLLVPGNHPVFANIEGSLYEKATRTLVVGLGPELKVPTGIQAIGPYACYGQHFSSISLPSTVKTIGAHAFQDATAPVFPLVEGVVTIEESAFRFFRATDDKLTLPSTVRTVGEEAFYKTYLSALTFNEGLEVLGDGAFSNAIFKVGETRSSSSNHVSSCIGANSGETYVDVNIPAGVKLGEGVFSELNTLAKRGHYSCKCDDYDRQLADIAAEADRLLGRDSSSGVKTTVTGVVRFHYTLGADASVPAKLFEVKKKTKLSGNYEQDAWAELSSTSATILPKVRVVVDAPANTLLTTGIWAFAKCDEVTFTQPVILKASGAGAFVNNKIGGMVTLDPSMTKWPFENCSFENWAGIPEHITTLESKACSAVTLTDEYLHAGLVEIAPDAFLMDSTFVVEPGSYAELWAMENNRLFTYAAGGDDLGWLTGDTGADDLSWLNPEGDAKYNEAKALEDAGDLAGAIALYEQVGDHRDAPERLAICQAALKQQTDYQAALDLEAAGDYIGATNGYKALGEYKDCAQRVEELEIKCVFQNAKALMAEGKFAESQKLVEPYMETEPEAEWLLMEAEFRVFGIAGSMSPEGSGWVLLGATHEKTDSNGETYAVIGECQAALIDCEGNILATKEICEKPGEWSEGFWKVKVYNRAHRDFHFIYLNAQGQNVFGQEYKKAETFHQGKAMVTTLDDRLVVIDTNGNEVCELPEKKGRSYLQHLGEDLVSFTEKGKVGLINLKGKVVLQPKYQSIKKFEYGLAMVTGLKNKLSKEAVINAKGKEVFALGKFDISGIVSENLIYLWENSKGLKSTVNLKGKEVLDSSYKYVERSGDLVLFSNNGRHGALDLELNTVISDSRTASWEDIIVGYESRVFALKKDKVYRLYSINNLNEPLFEQSSENVVMSPACPYILWKTEDKGWVILDCEGNIIF